MLKGRHFFLVEHVDHADVELFAENFRKGGGLVGVALDNQQVVENLQINIQTNHAAAAFGQHRYIRVDGKPQIFEMLFGLFIGENFQNLHFLPRGRNRNRHFKPPCSQLRTCLPK